jgi:hypothetical protein
MIERPMLYAQIGSNVTARYAPLACAELYRQYSDPS